MRTQTSICNTPAKAEVESNHEQTETQMWGQNNLPKIYKSAKG